MAAKIVKKNNREFNAETVRSIQEKEAVKFEERERKEALEFFRKETKQRISEIPKIIHSAIDEVIKYGYEKKAEVLSSSDCGLGLDYISPKLDELASQKIILEFEAVKTVLEWATRKGFGHEITIINGYWRISLTW